MIERMKELRRRRKRRKERLREKRGNSKSTLGVKKRSSRPFEKKEDDKAGRFASFITNDIDWSSIQSKPDLINALPDGVKAKKIWAQIPENVKDDILKQASALIKSRLFVGPGDWDGSLKQALLIMDKGRIPNGFNNFLATHGLSKYIQ